MSASSHSPTETDPATGAAQARSERSTDVEANPWVLHGIASGAVGAAVIALFFLAIDLFAGRPFWTPGALGAALFLGESLPSGAAAAPAVVAAYTVLHGGAFVVAGLAASFALLGHRREQGALTGLLGLSLAIFLALEVFFLGFIAFFASSVATGLVAELGPGRATLANALAAVAMAATLRMRAPYRGEGRSAQP